MKSQIQIFFVYFFANLYSREIFAKIIGQTLINADLLGDAQPIGQAVSTPLDDLERRIGSLIPLPPFVPTPRNLRAVP